MNGGRIHWAEVAIDNGVAALFALACAYPAVMLLGDLGQAMLAIALTTAALAFLAARAVLRATGSPRRPSRYVYDLSHAPDETLELTDVDRLTADELLLDDILTAVAPDSRVVQLFGRDERASAGELAGRIDRHLARRTSVPPADESHALFGALDQLRRNLR